MGGCLSHSKSETLSGPINIVPILETGEGPMTKHVLLVDDDALFRRSLAFNLEQSGYRVTAAADAETALAISLRDPPDLVLLDIGLPAMDGLEALRHFQELVVAPVIFVTARQRGLDEVLGLEMGADDYITKPFELDVLLARVRVVLRRSMRSEVSFPAPPGTLIVGDLAVNPTAHTVAVGGKPVELPPREFDLLYTLALHAEQVVSPDELLAQVWGPEYEGESQTVYVHVRWLREKLEDDPHSPRRIVTVRGVGYRLEPQDL